MKTTCMFSIALCLLALSCREKTMSNQTDTAASTGTTATTSTTTASAVFSEFTLKRLNQNLTIRRALGATPPNTLRVIFTGMIVHVLDKSTSGVERAVVVDATQHMPSIDFPDSMQSALQNVLGSSAVTCNSGLHLCTVDLKRVRGLA